MQLKQFYNIATKVCSRKKVLLLLVIYLTIKWHYRRRARERVWTQRQWQRDATKHVEHHDCWEQTHIWPRQTKWRWDAILPLHYGYYSAWLPYFPYGLGQRDVWKTRPIPRIVWHDFLSRSWSFFCQPIYYYAKVLTLTTAELQTSKCGIETYSVSYIQFVVGCRCMA